MGGDEAVGDPGELGDVRAQVARAERAVEADDERPDVAHAVPERLGGLARQRAAAGVGDRARDPDRPATALLLEERLEREDRRLGVERVEDGLDQQQVRAPVDQAAGLLEVGRDQLVEADVAGSGVVDVGRDRGRLVRGAERPGHPARALGRRVLVGSLPGERGGGPVELVALPLEPVVGLGDARRGEGVGAHDIGAGVEVGTVDVADDRRLRQGQHVGVPAQVVVVVRVRRAAVVGLTELVALDEGAHGAVDDEDPLTQGGGELLGRVGTLRRCGHCSPLGVGVLQPRNHVRNVDVIPGY